jgi:hypothetical protein
LLSHYYLEYNVYSKSWTKGPLIEYESSTTVTTEGDKETTVTTNITKADGVEVNRTIETTVTRKGHVIDQYMKGYYFLFLENKIVLFLEIFFYF